MSARQATTKDGVDHAITSEIMEYGYDFFMCQAIQEELLPEDFSGDIIDAISQIDSADATRLLKAATEYANAEIDRLEKKGHIVDLDLGGPS